MNNETTYQEIREFLESQTPSPRVLAGIENQILMQIDFFKDMLMPGDLGVKQRNINAQKELFEDYLRQQTLNAEKMIEKAIFEIKENPTGVLPSVIELYTWNRERINVYRLEFEALRLQSDKVAKTPFNDIFVGGKEVASEVLKALDGSLWRNNGKWGHPHGDKLHKSDIIIPYRVAQDAGILRSDKYSAAARMESWCNEMGVQIDEGDIRNFRKYAPPPQVTMEDLKTKRNENLYYTFMGIFIDAFSADTKAKIKNLLKS